jgi:hypothetical protein
MAANMPEGAHFLARYHLAAATLAVDHGYERVQGALLALVQAIYADAVAAEPLTTPSRTLRARLEELRHGETPTLPLNEAAPPAMDQRAA